MTRNVLILLILAAVVGLPFLLRPKDSLLARADETLVIITPHHEGIRYEFARGFRDWYKARTGKLVRIDWRVPGGTTEIARYLASEYQSPFEELWRFKMRMHWDDTVQHAFDDSKVKPGSDSAKDTVPQMARRAFLASDLGIGIDLFFGGGSYDFAQQAAAGRLVDSGFIRAHPELFGGGPAQIPQTLGGEPFWDKDGAWFGCVLSAFGICYNEDTLARMRVLTPPKNWVDLGNPEYLGQLALADPNMSGSVAKAFEMIIQQQIARQMARPPALDPAADKAQAAARVADGWKAAMRLIQAMGVNTRYFTDSSPKVPIDVAEGDAAVGMSIDFYGRFQAGSSRDPATGRERMHYFNPPGGTSTGVDPIGLLRGAPHPELAHAFMEYVMSVEGQKLWDFKVGTPGGPEKYALRRSPIRPDLYAPDYTAYRSDPDVYPYEEARAFTYHPEWTAALFSPIRFIVRVMCIDSHDEAREAGEALVRANFPPEASNLFRDVAAVTYDQAQGRISRTLKNPDKLDETRLAAELTARFRMQYRTAAELARQGK